MMPRELLVAWAGRHHRDAWEDLCAGYRKRIAQYAPVRDVPVRVAARGAQEESPARLRERVRVEGDVLRAALPEPSYVVALDRRGTEVSSEQLADRLTRWREEWPHPIAFVLGSDLGLSADFLSRARWRWSLGPLTLPHELARLVVYEQLYRAISIASGIAYHRRAL
jgi:23S rRNA (pseudouridine1915-N3)-methyltransferase